MGRGREQIEYLLQALQHSDVSGFELLEFLDIRSRLAIQEPLFNQDDRRRLEDIDRQLLQMAPSWLARIMEVADLAEMRQRSRDRLRRRRSRGPGLPPHRGLSVHAFLGPPHGPVIPFLVPS